jgi:hypothetical protein
MVLAEFYGPLPCHENVIPLGDASSIKATMRAANGMAR